MAASVPLEFRIAADLSQFRTDLATMSATLETTKASLTKMANSFDGSTLLDRANAMTVAIGNLGGAAMLTDTETARVNTTLTEAIAKYEALGQTAPQAMIDLAAATDQVGGTFDQLADHTTGVFTNLLSVGAIIGGVTLAYHAFTGFLSSSIETYAAAEAAENRLGVALQTQGYAIPGLKEQYEQLGVTYQNTTAFSHTAIDSAAALFVQLGNVGPGQMNKALQAATDLSAGLGIDLNQAVELLSRAFEGHTTALSRYGIVLDSSRVKAEGMGYVLDAIESKVGGQAQAQLDTYSGKVAQLGNAWDDLKEAVGGFLVSNPLVQEALTSLTAKTQAHHDAVAVDTTAMDTATDSTLPLMVQALDVAYESMKQSAAEAEAFAGAVKAIPPLPGYMTDPSQARGADFITKAAAAAHAVVLQTLQDGEDQKKAADAAAKAFQNAVDSMEGAISPDLSQKVKQLTQAVDDLGGASDLSNTEWANAADQAAKLRDQGAVLTPELQDLASAHDDIAHASARATQQVKDEQQAYTAWQATVGKFLADIPMAPPKATNLTMMVAPIDVSGALANQAAATKQIMDATYNDIENRMKAAGVDTRADMALTAAQYGQDFHDMAASGLYTSQELEAAFQKWAAAAIASGHGFAATFQTDLTNIAADALKAFSSGGDVGKAVEGGLVTLGSHMGQQLLGPLATDLSKSSPMLGQALGSLAGPLGGAAVTLGLDLGKKLFNALFGDAGRQAVVNFAQSMGGFDALHQQLSVLGAQGEQLWVQLTQGTGNNNAAQATANINAVTSALNTLHSSQNSQISDLVSKIQTLGGSIDPALDPYIKQLQTANILTQQNADSLTALEGDGKPSYATLTSLQSKYNLTAEQMGPSFHAEEVQANFQSLIDDIDTLTNGGMVDLSAAMFTVGKDGSESLSGLGTAIQSDIEDAMKAGIAIPDNLKPAAKALFDQGDLLDANGKKVTDFSTVTFGATMQDDLETLNKTLNDLIHTMMGTGQDGLKGAMAAVDGLKANPTITVKTDWSSFVNGPGKGAFDFNAPDTSFTAATASTGGIVKNGKVIPFPTSYYDSGGFVPRGTDTVPAMLTPGEVVLNAAQQAALAAAMGGGGQNITVHVTLDPWTGQAKTFVEGTVQKMSATGKLKTRAQPGRSY